jgi:hypothetical protein
MTAAIFAVIMNFMSVPPRAISGKVEARFAVENALYQ